MRCRALEAVFLLLQLYIRKQHTVCVHGPLAYHSTVSKVTLCNATFLLKVHKYICCRLYGYPIFSVNDLLAFYLSCLQMNIANH